MRATYLWFLQLLTGLLILVLVVVNLVLMHLRAILGFFGVDAPELSLASRASPGVLEAVLVALAGIILFHALSGLRLTVLELTPTTQRTQTVNRAIMAGGAILIIVSFILLLM